MKVREYLDRQGNSPYAKWFDRLNVAAAIKVSTAIHRMDLGNFSNVKGVGTGVFEYRIDSGPAHCARAIPTHPLSLLLKYSKTLV